MRYKINIKLKIKKYFFFIYETEYKKTENRILYMKIKKIYFLNKNKE